MRYFPDICQVRSFLVFTNGDFGEKEVSKVDMIMCVSSGGAMKG